MTRTPVERLQDVLADFRRREPAPAPWLGEPSVKSVIAAWPRVPAKITIPLTIGGVPMHGPNRWRYAWKFRDLDIAAVARVSGLPAADAAAALDRLAAARYVYPDGTLSAAAQAALSSAE